MYSWYWKCIMYSLSSRVFTVSYIFMYIIIQWRKDANEKYVLLCNMNLLRPTDEHTRHQPRPTLVQIKVCRLFGAKPLSEPMLVMVSWTLGYIFQFNLNQSTTDNWRRWIWICHVQNGVHFVSASIFKDPDGTWSSSWLFDIQQSVINSTCCLVAITGTYGPAPSHYPAIPIFFKDGYP